MHAPVGTTVTAVTTTVPGADAAPATPSAGTPGARRLPQGLATPTRVALVALLTVLAVEHVRTGLFYLFATAPTTAAQTTLTALGTFALPGVVAAGLLLAAGARRTGYPDGRVLLAGTALLAVAWLTAHTVGGGSHPALWLVTVAVAVAVLTLAVAFVAGRSTGAHQAVGGLTLGVGLSAALLMVFDTWEALRRDNPLAGPLIIGVLLALALVAAWAGRRDVPSSRPRRLWVLGPYLTLAVVVLANPLFTKSPAMAEYPGETLAAVSAFVLVGTSALAAWLVLSARLLSGRVRIAAAVATPVALAAMFWLPATAVVAVGVLQVAAAVVLVTVLGSGRPAQPSVVRTALATAVVGLGAILPLLIPALLLHRL